VPRDQANRRQPGGRLPRSLAHVFLGRTLVVAFGGNHGKPSRTPVGQPGGRSSDSPHGPAQGGRCSFDCFFCSNQFIKRHLDATELFRWRNYVAAFNIAQPTAGDAAFVAENLSGDTGTGPLRSKYCCVDHLEISSSQDDLAGFLLKCPFESFSGCLRKFQKPRRRVDRSSTLSHSTNYEGTSSMSQLKALASCLRTNSSRVLVAPLLKR
jgi:hypothetical protein